MRAQHSFRRNRVHRHRMRIVAMVMPAHRRGWMGVSLLVDRQLADRHQCLGDRGSRRCAGTGNADPRSVQRDVRRHAGQSRSKIARCTATNARPRGRVRATWVGIGGPSRSRHRVLQVNRLQIEAPRRILQRQLLVDRTGRAVSSRPLTLWSANWTSRMRSRPQCCVRRAVRNSMNASSSLAPAHLRVPRAGPIGPYGSTGSEPDASRHCCRGVERRRGSTARFSRLRRYCGIGGATGALPSTRGRRTHASTTIEAQPVGRH